MSTATERREVYSSPRWALLRESVMRREGRLCELCRSRGLTVAADIVHHIRPIRSGGAVWDKANLCAVCRTCHHREHAAEREERGNPGWLSLVKELLPAT